MPEVINIEYGTSPDRLHSMIGFQEEAQHVLNPKQIRIVKFAAITFTQNWLRAGSLTIEDEIVAIEPDIGEPYTELQAVPSRLWSERDIAAGHKLLPDLVQAIAAYLTKSETAQVKVKDGRQSLTAARTLFDGKMLPWWKKGLPVESDTAPHDFHTLES